MTERDDLYDWYESDDAREMRDRLRRTGLVALAYLLGLAAATVGAIIAVSG